MRPVSFRRRTALALAPAFLLAGLPGPADSPTIPMVASADIQRAGQLERLALKSESVLVLDAHDSVALIDRNSEAQRPIASLTKLMTALVVLSARQPLEERIAITRDDRDRLKGSHSRLPFDASFTRGDLLRAALASSDNRAASALARHYPGGAPAFVAAMNERAAVLGMAQTRFVDASGLSPDNRSSARDLARLALALEREPLLGTLSTTENFAITNHATGHDIALHNTNRLLYGSSWQIRLSKTGYTSEAGNCLLMTAAVAGRPVVIVLLNSWGKQSKYGDSQRIRDWLARTEQRLRPLAYAAESPPR